MRQMLAEAGTAAYSPLESFNVAKADVNGYAIMEGDGGGQVYLSVPMREVVCGEPALRHLLLEVDHLCWHEPDMATLYYEQCKVGQGIPGGMGGGVAADTLWVHPRLAGKRDLIQKYLAGEISSILG